MNTKGNNALIFSTPFTILMVAKVQIILPQESAEILKKHDLYPFLSFGEIIKGAK